MKWEKKLLLISIGIEKSVPPPSLKVFKENIYSQYGWLSYDVYESLEFIQFNWSYDFLKEKLLKIIPVKEFAKWIRNGLEIECFLLEF